MTTPAYSLRRATLFAAGSLSLVLGVIGIFLPLLPTTCFLLLSGWCFARSSPRMYEWLHHNPMFGKYLREYRDDKVIPPRLRLVTLATLWLALAFSAVLVSTRPWIVLLLLGIGVTVSWHLFSLESSADPASPSTA